ncbi:putative deacetylase LmbE-like domain superfamily [Plasmopara halstedii]
MMLFELGEDELETLLEILKYILFGTNVILFLFAGLIFLTSSLNEESRPLSAVALQRRALIVTAHPDDESMFFLPLVHSLQQSPKDNNDVWQIHLLCLSQGNFDGLGDVRVKELKASASYIGLSSGHINVLEDFKLQDGMMKQWEVSYIAKIVTKYIEEHTIDTVRCYAAYEVFTFDDYGVSGHPNHIASYYGVSQAIRELEHKCSAATASDNTRIVRGWALQSTNILRKYLGVLDMALSYWESRGTKQHFVFVFRPRWNYNAMALHRSQFVWYRRLFVIFSRYTFINTFRSMSSIDTNSTAAERKKLQ